MSLLLGTQTGNAPNIHDNSPQANSTDAFYNGDGDLAVADGVASSIYLYVPTWAGGATGVKITIYNAVLAILGTSGVFVPGDGTGLLNKPLSLSASIVNGAKYYQVVQSTGGYIDVRQYTDQPITHRLISVAANYPYASPPSTLPAPDIDGPSENWIMWIDGTLGGGGGATLMGQACY